MNKGIRWVLAALGLVILLWLTSAFYTVDETEVGIVTRFGRPLPGVVGSGLHLKMPWPVDALIRLDARLLVFDSEPSEMLTQDKKNVLVDSFICWRIADPLRYTQTVRTRPEAEARLLDISSSELGAALGNEPMDSFLRTTGEPVKFSEISSRISQSMNQIARSSFGIEIVDFQINGFNFPPQNRASVIDRMRAERARIATQYRSEGEEEALKIEAETTTEREQILAQARSQAEAIRGEGEAQAMNTLGDAYGRDPEFYRFSRTLESYEKMIDDKTTIFLESDSKLMKLLGGE